MAKGKRSMRDEVAVALIVIAIVLLAIILGWWAEHPIIGWTIIGIIIIAFGFSLFKFPRFRVWLLKKGKSAGEKAAFKEEPEIVPYEKQEKPMEHSQILSTVVSNNKKPENNVSSRSKKAEVDKVQPLSESEKAILIDIVRNKCENPRCRHVQYLEVHHIIPRAEGGPNSRRNLIVLCPTCHTAADKGGFSRAQLRQWTKRRKY